MKNALMIIILVGLYVVYLVLGIYFQFRLAWVDWNRPYFHFALIAGGKEALPAFVLPVLIWIWAGYVWYQKSMMGEE